MAKSNNKKNLAEVNEVKAVETKDSPAAEVKAVEVKAVETKDSPVAEVKNVLLVFDRYRRKIRTDLGAYPDNKYGRWVLACDICSEYPPIDIATDEKIKNTFAEGDFDQVGDFLNVNGLEIVSCPLTVDFFAFAKIHV